MSDLSPSTAAATVTCPRCGAQNPLGQARCSDCGTDLPSEPVEQRRDDLELEEAWRAAAAGGYDQDVAVVDGDVTCPTCGTQLGIGDVALDGLELARDTPGGRDEVGVAVFRCPSCGTASRAELDGDDLARAREARRSDGTQEVEPRASAPAGATEDRPLGADRRFFDEGGPGTLREQGDLLDDEGEDIRQYTGEPVETEEGWVTPHQQNVGPGNMAGQGEWPDPNAPSAMPKGDEPPADPKGDESGSRG